MLPAASQILVTEDTPRVVLGAGAAGASTAYYLQKYAERDGVAVNITIFEKTDHIGGRTLTVNPYDNPHEAVELGASIFVEQNFILYNASQEFELPLRDPYGKGADSLVIIWDGEKIVFEQSEDSWQWWDLTKLFWRYGLAPYRTKKLVGAAQTKFHKLYESPYFPFRSLTARAFELDLASLTGQTGEQYLEQNNVGQSFAHEIIQAATRVNYATNLGKIHGLTTLVSMAPEGAVAVSGGNWRIFDRMVKNTGAALYLNTSVSSITLDGKQANAAEAKYLISTRPTDKEDANEETDVIAFDDVVIATPYQFSNIKTAGDIIKTAIDEIPYVRLHVTIFASPFQMSPDFFSLDDKAKIPTSVLTTLADDDDASSGANGSGKAGFFSISSLRTIVNPATLQEEYLYKIFSPEKITPEFLSQLLGVPVPDSFITPQESGDEGDTVILQPISWYYPHVFFSYPQELPRVTFQDPILREGLYYTSGMESFISTMETSALMGMNVARLIVDNCLGLNTGNAVDKEQARPSPQKGKQSILAGVQEDEL
ncbi:putative prenylcysteine oxidase protein [Phaeoacremonium minimum UCRPA7]|uniref:Putative prenylcysteine oxidase protein n=1 Tax=Phaeoacremonium minimum (strain UCR-PA7) TaxID=1286976 RepID=R8BDI1_PHAM7|nr:putative prenylcysteine oxidase protein [Phaeoacremonium minimum UCRPA7]EON97353.1 putative prenylcysteine oxidase protein [Phaeoacremonium minimum UCRPA7]